VVNRPPSNVDALLLEGAAARAPGPVGRSSAWSPSVDPMLTRVWGLG
jgi:hypothetical protein